MADMTEDTLEILVGSTLPVKHGFFLLVKSKTGATKGLWNNPGGRLEEGESFEEAAERETAEETGYAVSLGRVIATYSFQTEKESVTKCVYEAIPLDRKGGYDSDEIEEIRWFSRGEVREMDTNLFTFGALSSIEDFLANRFNQEYSSEKIP